MKYLGTPPIGYGNETLIRLSDGVAALIFNDGSILFGIEHEVSKIASKSPDQRTELTITASFYGSNLEMDHVYRKLKDAKENEGARGDWFTFDEVEIVYRGREDRLHLGFRLAIDDGTEVGKHRCNFSLEQLKTALDAASEQRKNN